MTIDTPLLPLATLMVYSLRLSSQDKEYHYCNGELHIVYDEKGNEIWRIKKTSFLQEALVSLVGAKGFEPLTPWV